MGSRPDHRRNELLYRAGDIERHRGPERALPSRGRDILVQDGMPTTAQRWDAAVSEFERCLRVRDMHGIQELVNLGRGCIQHIRTCFASGSLGPGQAGTLISGVRRYVLLPRACGADLEYHQSVFRALWGVHRSWSLAIPAEFKNVPELSPFTFDAPFVALFVGTSEGQSTSMVRRENL